MKKFLCCLLALATLCAGTATTVSCGGDGGNNSPVSSSMDLTNVTLKLTKKSYNIENGQSVAIEYDCSVGGEQVPASQMVFTSNDPTIATVSADGIVTGVAGGKTTVSVECGTRSVTAIINVTMRENRLTISDESVRLLVGDTNLVQAKA